MSIEWVISKWRISFFNEWFYVYNMFFLLVNRIEGNYLKVYVGIDKVKGKMKMVVVD